MDGGRDEAEEEVVEESLVMTGTFGDSGEGVGRFTPAFRSSLSALRNPPLSLREPPG